jgi:NAD(P)-dependent dehydrogenase (short-subunit alcohol dehydrogenase family)
MSGKSGNGHPRGFDQFTLDLSKHNGVVTGAARGIARATCVALAEEGIQRLACVDMHPDVESLAGEINAQVKRPVAIPFRGDVTDAAFRRSVFAEMDRRGRARRRSTRKRTSTASSTSTSPRPSTGRSRQSRAWRRPGTARG